MAITGPGMANMGFYGVLPMGISNYGGDVQVWNVPEYASTTPNIAFNPMALASLNGSFGAGMGIPQLDLNLNVQGLADALLAPVMENLAAQSVNTNTQGASTLETRLQALLEAEGATDEDKDEINALLNELKEQQQAMQALEESGLSNKEIYKEADQITKNLTEISKKASKISQRIEGYDAVEEPQGIEDGEYVEDTEATGQPTPARAGLDSDEYGPEFLEKVKEIAKRINCDYRDLLALMNSESGINAQEWCKIKGEEKKAVGLIQFRRESAQDLGTSLPELYRMSPMKQLDYVEKFFQRWIDIKGIRGQRLSAADLYTLAYVPAYFRQNVVSREGERRYDKNKGLDVNGDGKVTQSDLAQQITRKRISDNVFYA